MPEIFKNIKPNTWTEDEIIFTAPSHNDNFVADTEEDNSAKINPEERDFFSNSINSDMLSLTDSIMLKEKMKNEKKI